MRGARRVVRWVGLGVLALLFAATVHAEEGTVASVKISDRDRQWNNYSHEAAVVDEGRLYVELRGMTQNNDTNAHYQYFGSTILCIQCELSVIQRGFPAGEPSRPPLFPNGYFQGGNGRRDDVVTLSGGKIDLVASYGLFKNTEVGFDLPAIFQGLDFPNPTTGNPNGTYSENENGFGDMTIYGKYKYPIPNLEDLAVGGGVEVRIPTGDESKRLGTGEVGTTPFLSLRYTLGRAAVGGNVGYQFNQDGLGNVKEWGTYGVLRVSDLWSFRTEITGRHFEYGGSNIDDVFLMPGIDFNLSNAFVIRPEGLAGLSTPAIDWGLGVGVSYLF